MTSLLNSLLGIPCLTTAIHDQDWVLFEYDENFSQIIPNGEAVYTECARLSKKHDISVLPISIISNCHEILTNIQILCQRHKIQLPIFKLTSAESGLECSDLEQKFKKPLMMARPTIIQCQKTLHKAYKRNLQQFFKAIFQHPNIKQNVLLHSYLLEQALSETNINEVEFLLSNTILSRHRDWYQSAALEQAVKEGKTALAKQLISVNLKGFKLKIAFEALCLSLKIGQLHLADEFLEFPEIRRLVAVKSQDLLHVIAEGGNCDSLDMLLTIPDFSPDMAGENNRAMRTACRWGHTSFVLKLLTFPEVVSNVCANDNEAFFNACLAGKIELIQILLENINVNNLSPEKVQYALVMTCRVCNIEAMKILMRLPGVEVIPDTWFLALFENACKQNNISIINKIIANDTWRAMVVVNLKRMIRDNAAQGNMIALKALLKLDKGNVKATEISDLLYLVSKQGNLKLVKKLLDIPDIKLAFLAKPRYVFKSAYEGCHLDVILFLRQTLGKEIFELNIWTMIVASACNDLELLREMLALPNMKENATYADNQAFHLACSRGHLDIVNELLTILQVKQKAHINDNSTFNLVCEIGNVAILRCLLLIPAVKENLTGNNEALCVACRAEQIEIARILLSVEEVINSAALNDNKPLSLACDVGNLDLVRLLLTIPNVRKTLYLRASHIFQITAENGNVDIIREFYQYPQLAKIMNMNRNQLLRTAITEGTHNVAFELLHYPEVLLTIADNNNAILVLAIDEEVDDIVARLLQERSVLQKITLKQYIAILHMEFVEMPFLELSSVFAMECLGKSELQDILNSIDDANTQALSAFTEYLRYYGYEFLPNNLSGKELKTALFMSVTNSFVNYYRDPRVHAGLILQMQAEIAYLNPSHSNYSELAGDHESAMSPNLVSEAYKQFKLKIKIDFASRFNEMGGIPNIESALYGKLLDKKREILSQMQTEEAAEIVKFIEDNNMALKAREESVLVMARKYFTSTTDTLDIALRALDSGAPKFGWEKLFIPPSKRQAENTIFSTRATNNKALNLKQASDICREMLCYAFLVSQDVTLSEQERHELFDVLILYVAEISRAHNESSKGYDNPSCFPGTISRLYLIFTRHPKYHEVVSLRSAVNDIANQIVIKAFSCELDLLENPAERLMLYEAITLIDHTNALTILQASPKVKIRDTSGNPVNLNMILLRRERFFRKYFGCKGEDGIKQIRKTLEERFQLKLPENDTAMAIYPLINMSKASPSTTLSLTESYQQTCSASQNCRKQMNPFKQNYDMVFELCKGLPEERRTQLATSQFIDGAIKSAYYETSEISPSEIEEHYQSLKVQIEDEFSDLERNWCFFDKIIQKLCLHLQCDKSLFPTEEDILQNIANTNKMSPQPILHMSEIFNRLSLKENSTNSQPMQRSSDDLRHHPG